MKEIKLAICHACPREVQDKGHEDSIQISCSGLHKQNVQYHGLHGIEATVAAEVLVVDYPKVDCKEDRKAVGKQNSFAMCKCILSHTADQDKLIRASSPGKRNSKV